MAKLTEFKNPLVQQKGDLLSIDDWKGAIIYVMFLGAAFTVGSKLMAKLDDAVIPGENTPKQFRAATTVATQEKDVIQIF